MGASTRTGSRGWTSPSGDNGSEVLSSPNAPYSGMPANVNNSPYVSASIPFPSNIPYPQEPSAAGSSSTHAPSAYAPPAYVSQLQAQDGNGAGLIGEQRNRGYSNNNNINHFPQWQQQEQQPEMQQVMGSRGFGLPGEHRGNEELSLRDLVAKGGGSGANANPYNSNNQIAPSAPPQQPSTFKFGGRPPYHQQPQQQQPKMAWAEEEGAVGDQPDVGLPDQGECRVCVMQVSGCKGTV